MRFKEPRYRFVSDDLLFEVKQPARRFDALSLAAISIALVSGVIALAEVFPEAQAPLQSILEEIKKAEPIARSALKPFARLAAALD